MYNILQGQVSKNTETNTYNYEHPIAFDPSTYVCRYIDNPIRIDGIITSSEWHNSEWSHSFVDIQGNRKESPHLDTKIKMAWDSQYFYFAATLQEPHIWATLTERDAIMYHDDDFEIFIDPDGDGHNYFEFEMNAHNAIWDLLMLYPYNIDNGHNYVMDYNIMSIKSQVHIEGTLNQTADIDDHWSLEVAIPWGAFKDLMRTNHVPAAGDQWRINFSRVDWTMDIKNDGYHKTMKNNRPLPEDNWVWSPTGYVNMHKPETWGYVQFEMDSDTQFQQNENEKVKWALWQNYYQLKECYKKTNKACSLEVISIPQVDVLNYNFKPILNINDYGFNISAPGLDGQIFVINEQALLKTLSNN